MTDREPYNTSPFSEPLDELLRTWHDENRAAAEAGRGRLLRALEEEEAAARASRRLVLAPPGPRTAGRLFRPATFRAAAALVLMITGVALVATWPSRTALARETIMVADGGRLDALDEYGVLIGPCPLRHTDVEVDVSGLIARVNVRQRFENTYDEPIEAVYTFPLGHRGAVDRMTMTIGDRVVLGTVRERAKARAEYEAARSAGYVAGLLEQERTNIFTQSVANIAPGATIEVEIGYVETVTVRDGTYHFDFPMTVAPRYVPGTPLSSGTTVPAELEARHGLVLRGPARISLGQRGPAAQTLGSLAPDALRALLMSAMPIGEPGTTWWGADSAQMPALWTTFAAIHPDGTVERGALFADGTGRIAGRWFYVDPVRARAAGGGFALGTDEVPDAARVTPMPNRPGERAGHDVSVRVRIDSGGPPITGHRSVAHAVTAANPAPTALAVELKDRNAIPNRDFRLEWTLADDRIEDSVFAHRRAPKSTGAGPLGAALARSATEDPWGRMGHGFFTLALQPPARVAPEDIAPREIVFVLDSSGSMEGFPIETAKAVMRAALDTMREDDTFNVYSFNTDWQSLWREPRPADAGARSEAQAWVDGRTGGGGTEMRPAIEAALSPDGEAATLGPVTLADLPADGRAVALEVKRTDLRGIGHGSTLQVLLPNGVALDVRDAQGLTLDVPGSPTRVEISGTWRTEDGRRVLVAQNIRALPDRAPADTRARYVFLLSDGELSNEEAVIDTVRNRIRASRLFTVGIGSSPNRALLDGMAAAGRGVSDYVAESDDAAGAVARFVKRIETPLLTNITLDFAGGFEILETIPPIDAIPDLLDDAPLIVHGRYAQPGRGSVTVRGLAGAGPFARTIDLDLPADDASHDAIASLWARAKIDRARDAKDVASIVALGERFQLLTEHTSFIAVEAARVHTNGVARLVRIPIELPEGQSYPGTFGTATLTDQIVQTDAGLDNREPTALGYWFEAQPAAPVEEQLRRVYQLHTTQQYGEALKTIDQVLAIDAQNADALMLRDTIATTQLYDQYMALQRQKERNLSSTLIAGQERLILPRQNQADLELRQQQLAVDPIGNLNAYFSWDFAPADKTVDADTRARGELLNYPADWSGRDVELGRNVDSTLALTPDRNDFHRGYIAKYGAMSPTTQTVAGATAVRGGELLGVDRKLSDLEKNATLGVPALADVTGGQTVVHAEPEVHYLATTATAGTAYRFFLKDAPTSTTATPSAGFEGVELFGLEKGLGADGGRDALRVSGEFVAASEELGELFRVEDGSNRFGGTFRVDAPTPQPSVMVTVLEPSTPAEPTLRYDVAGLVLTDAAGEAPAGEERSGPDQTDALARLTKAIGELAAEASPTAASTVVDGGIQVSAEADVHRDIHQYLAQVQYAQSAGRFVQEWWALPLAEQRAQIADAVAALEREQRAALEVARRAERLRRVIDQRLWTLVPKPGASDDEAAAEPPVAVTVSVLVSDVQPETLALVRDAGLDILDTVPHIPMVVGTIAPKDLEALGLLDLVRRIEPTERAD